MTFNAPDFLKHLPQKPGVYQMMNVKGEVIYVGKAKDLKDRVSSYFRKNLDSIKTQRMVSCIADVKIIITQSDNEALVLEQNLIKSLHPKYNILLRDDKSYPYIALSVNHVFPRLSVYRGAKQKGMRYFGPFPSGLAVRDSLQFLQKLFKLRSCNDTFFSNRSRPCLKYQIKRCSAPCVKFISPEDYAQDMKKAILFLEGKDQDLLNNLSVQMEAASQSLNYELAAELRDQINKLRHVQEQQKVMSSEEADYDVIGLCEQYSEVMVILIKVRNGKLLATQQFSFKLLLDETKEMVMSSFISQYYLADEQYHDQIPKIMLVNELPEDRESLTTVLSERYQHKIDVVRPQRGERCIWVDMAVRNAQEQLAIRLQKILTVKKRVEALQTALAFKQPLTRIECFDISHTQGEATVASCVVYDHELGLLKSEYRRFNITDITPGDDYAALKQAVERRYAKHLESDKPLPTMVIIDGGKGQLQSVKPVFEALGLQDIFVIGISKGEGRKAEYDQLWRADNGELLDLDKHPLARHVIQEIRDEAHRFAITGHRQRRDKKRKESLLESIDGIGPKRRQALLQRFGGQQGLEKASIEEISKVSGISDSIARKIYATLHPI